MTTIPPDAADWDSGDWIEWHRQRDDGAATPCTAASDDQMAKAHSVYSALIHAARSYHRLTGQHLRVYPAIANLYGTLHHGLPLHGPAQLAGGWTKVECISPQAATNIITVDLTVPFDQLLVVRISPDFEIEGRMIARSALPQTATVNYDLQWSDLPRPDHI